MLNGLLKENKYLYYRNKETYTIQQICTQYNKYAQKTTSIHRKQLIYTENNKYTQKTTNIHRKPDGAHQRLLYTNIDQILVNSLHGLLNCEIVGLGCRVITTRV